MPTAMHSLEELVVAFRNHEMKLPALFDALGERGAVSADQHSKDVAWLEQLRNADGLEPRVVHALVAKLENIQLAVTASNSVPVLPAAAKVAAPATDAAAPVEAGADATRLHAQVAPVVAAPAPSATGSEADAESPEADGTVLHGAKPVAPPPAADGNATGVAGGTSASTWEHVATESGGESATLGMLLKGRFLLERELGRGGMGVVFLARDDRKVEARDRDPYVAVKVLNDEFRRHPDSLIALQRETRRSQQLAHDNIVRAYDFDKDGTIVFMTMEYVDGISLKTLIREQAYDGMPLAKAWPLIEGMTRALGRAHAAGVVHSDFKPGNVMVTKAGVAKVFDFGIARAGKLPGAVGADDETVFDASTLGAMTPAYASLEMLRGAEPTPADDIYALGCVIYELLTGKHPFDRASAEVAQQEHKTPPLVHGLTKRQASTLRRLVAFTHQKRVQSADEVLEGLRPRGFRERVLRPLMFAVVLLLLAAAVGWGVLDHLRERRLAEVAEGFQASGSQRYADATQAIAALSALGDNARKRLLVEHGDAVQQFLVDQVDVHWNPAKGQRDYAGAETVFAQVDKLHLFLPQMDMKRAEVEKQKYDLDHPKPPPVVVAATSATPAPATTTATANTAQEAADDAKAEAAAAAAREAAAQQAAAAAAAKAHMRDVVAGLLRAGEANFTQQKYSAAIANANAALQIDPGNDAAKHLLERAQTAQKQAMSDITIH